jgi:hypothetical protein
MTLATLLFTACEQNQLDNTQNTISCTPSDTVIAAEGGEFVVAISSSTAWSATTNQKWITISPTSGQGDAYVTIQVAAGEQAEAKVLFATGENTATLTITRGEKQSSDDEEDPSNPNDGKTYPYLTIYDLMPLHLIPRADVDDILWEMGYTSSGSYNNLDGTFTHRYTTKHNDIIHILEISGGIVGSIGYTASKGVELQATKDWLMHIPENIALPNWNKIMEFSSGSTDVERVYDYQGWIELVSNYGCDNIWGDNIWAYWEAEEVQSGDYAVLIGYDNSRDEAYLEIRQVYTGTGTEEPGESEE